jgi:hypothetical protein
MIAITTSSSIGVKPDRRRSLFIGDYHPGREERKEPGRAPAVTPTPAAIRRRSQPRFHSGGDSGSLGEPSTGRGVMIRVPSRILQMHF